MISIIVINIVIIFIIILMNFPEKLCVDLEDDVDEGEAHVEKHPDVNHLLNQQWFQYFQLILNLFRICKIL